MRPAERRLRVCAFFSSGPHYRRVLQALRAEYPGAALWAFVPPRYPRELAEALADHVEVMEQDRYGARDLPGILRLLRRLRRARFDVFVVMFDSPRLAVLARLSGAPVRRCHSMEGRDLPLRASVFGQILRQILRRIAGRWTYAHVCNAVRQPVGEDREDS